MNILMQTSIGMMCGFIMSSANVWATCPDYSIATAPTFTKPAKKSFRHLGSSLLAATYGPWHMAYDQLVNSKQTATVVAKFDYDGVLHKDLEDEYVQTYIAGTGISGWQYVGRYLTNSDGKVSVNIGSRPVGEYRVRFVVEGDLSVVDGFVSVVESGRQAVLFDVDGTLTINDFEALLDYTGIKTATAYAYAKETVNAYKNKGYQVIYVTARPYTFTKDAREWFASMGIPLWHYRTYDQATFPSSSQTQSYKAAYIQSLQNTVGLNIIRAYGNATTDIGAYADAGIAKANTYIIGSNAGVSSTQPIYNDYSYHYSTVVLPTANSASCSN